MKLPNSAARSLGIVRREFGATQPTTPSNTSRAVWTLSDGSTWTAQNFFPPNNTAGLMEVPCDPGARRKLCDIPASGTKYPRSTWCGCKYGNGKLFSICAEVAKKYDPWTGEGRAEMQLLANKAGFTEFNPWDSVGAMRDAAADLSWRNLREPPLPKTVSTDRYAAIIWPQAGQLEQCMPPCPNGAKRTADGKCVCIDSTHLQPDSNGPCFPPCDDPYLTRASDGRCVPYSQEVDVSGCPEGYLRAQGGMCVPVELALPDRKCPPGTVEMTGGECKPLTAGIGGGLPILRCRIPGQVYIPGKGCIPESEVPCLAGYYKDPTTKKCKPIPPCGDEEPYQYPGSGMKYTLDNSKIPPKCVLRCPPDQYYSKEAGYKCVPIPGLDKKQQPEEGGMLSKLLLGAGGGFLVGGPVGAAVGAAAAVALLKK